MLTLGISGTAGTGVTGGFGALFGSNTVGWGILLAGGCILGLGVLNRNLGYQGIPYVPSNSIYPPHSYQGAVSLYDAKEVSDHLMRDHLASKGEGKEFQIKKER